MTEIFQKAEASLEGTLFSEGACSVRGKSNFEALPTGWDVNGGTEEVAGLCTCVAIVQIARTWSMRVKVSE